MSSLIPLFPPFAIIVHPHYLFVLFAVNSQIPLADRRSNLLPSRVNFGSVLLRFLILGQEVNIRAYGLVLDM
jgi:hypothetical protein